MLSYCWCGSLLCLGIQIVWISPAVHHLIAFLQHRTQSLPRVTIRSHRAIIVVLRIPEVDWLG